MEMVVHTHDNRPKKLLKKRHILTSKWTTMAPSRKTHVVHHPVAIISYPNRHGRRKAPHWRCLLDTLAIILNFDCLENSLESAIFGH